MPDVLSIANHDIYIGTRKKLEIPVATLFDYTPLSIPVEVIRGKRGGPTLFISAAIHGDEIIGSEIVKRLLARKELQKLRGTLIAIPIVNPFGYNNNIRYLPDRRDLNRCFPGSDEGSLAARMANTFMKEIVSKCDYGIDIHSGAQHRINFPQIRLDVTDKDCSNLAKAFAAPIVVHSPLRSGTLRKAAAEMGVKTLLFETGEALRFDEHSISVGLRGMLNVMRELKMLRKDDLMETSQTVIIAKSSHWIRAKESGSLRTLKKLGSFVSIGELLGLITDPFGARQVDVTAVKPGVIIGSVTMPLVNRGNALFHIATLEEMRINDENNNIVYDQDIDIENEDWFIRK
jgi:predicted deacylase